MVASLKTAGLEYIIHDEMRCVIAPPSWSLNATEAVPQSSSLAASHASSYLFLVGRICSVMLYCAYIGSCSRLAVHHRITVVKMKFGVRAQSFALIMDVDKSSRVCVLASCWDYDIARKENEVKKVRTGVSGHSMAGSNPAREDIRR